MTDWQPAVNSATGQGNGASMRLLIVDDHPMTCAGLKSLLQACYPDARIEARSAASALLEGADRWDYIFLDMHLPGVRFPQLLQDIHALAPRVILISASPEPEYVEQARARGVRGLLLKNADAERILDGFRRIQAGERVFDDAADLSGQRPAAAELLTARQQEVYDALIGGLSNKQIARKLGIAENTVKEHVAAVLALFGARNRLELLLQQRRPPVV